MEQLIEMVLQALRAAGIHCVRALDEETLPRLKAPMVAVGIMWSMFCQLREVTGCRKARTISVRSGNTACTLLP